MRETYINRALREPRLKAGVSQQALAVTWGPGAFMAVMIGSSYGWWPWSLIPILISLSVHTVLKWVYKNDHRHFAINARFKNMADEYQPHPREKLPKPFERPEKMGRGIRL